MNCTTCTAIRLMWGRGGQMVERMMDWYGRTRMQR